MANEFVARNGVIALNNSTITGSLIVTNGITGSLSGSHVGDTTGTASWAASASIAISASYALTASNVNGGATNYIALWSNTTSLSSSILTQIAGNIGVNIGTATPAARLQVSGTVNVVNFRGSGSLTTSSIFTVDGAAGRLFSVNDSLSGSLFSVNTIAGLPVVEAFSDNTVRIGQYGQKALFVSQSRVGVGKETLLNANIDISGSAIITGSLNITGSITTAGTITATTLIVQTITSSIEYSSGSNIFGSKLTDTQQFTGSVGITGSLTSNGNTVVTGSFTVFSGSLIDFQVTDGGTKQGNSATDNHVITGSVSISGSSHTTIGNITLTGSFAHSGSITINSGSIVISSGSIFTPKVIGNTANPVIVSGSGAGTAASGGISGSDVAGIIRLLTGTAPTAKNPIFTVTFSSAYATVPYVLVTPASYSSSLSTGGVSGTFTTASTTGFSMFSGDGSLRGATAYSWSYFVVG